MTVNLKRYTHKPEKLVKCKNFALPNTATCTQNSKLSTGKLNMAPSCVKSGRRRPSEKFNKYYFSLANKLKLNYTLHFTFW